MNSSSVVGDRDRPDDKRKQLTPTREPQAIKELRVQLHDMRRAAHPFLSDEPRKAYWTNAWELVVVHAAARVEGNKKEFYGLRLTAVIS